MKVRGGRIFHRLGIEFGAKVFGCLGGGDAPSRNRGKELPGVKGVVADIQEKSGASSGFEERIVISIGSLSEKIPRAIIVGGSDKNGIESS